MMQSCATSAFPETNDEFNTLWPKKKKPTKNSVVADF